MFPVMIILMMCSLMAAASSCGSNTSVNKATDSVAATTPSPESSSDSVIVGAARVDVYAPLLRDQRVALLSNQTGMVGDQHTLDVMLAEGLDVKLIFSPEHGFRGTADAGEQVNSSVDEKTGVRIASLYDGKSHIPSKATMDSIDVIVVDIQDVGLRFYTYYVTMINLMEAAAKYDKTVVVLDRPNPNGMYVDGPILDMKLRSGVGRLPIPIVHGMTLGELAQMANSEGWLEDSVNVDLKVVKCLNYTHQTRYQLPIAPSPNLPNMHAIYLYPSMCYFEGTMVSLGRGTDWPFQVYGHPDMTNRDFTFTPTSRAGAKTPPQQDKLCHGVDLRNLDDEAIIAKGIDLSYVIDAYRDLTSHGKTFFLKDARFFDLLMGNTGVRKMIEQGKTAQEIKASWADDVARFKEQRRRYLLYDE